MRHLRCVRVREREREKEREKDFMDASHHCFVYTIIHSQIRGERAHLQCKNNLSCLTRFTHNTYFFTLSAEAAIAARHTLTTKRTTKVLTSDLPPPFHPSPLHTPPQPCTSTHSTNLRTSSLRWCAQMVVKVFRP